MLMALLYKSTVDSEDQIVAAAPACDQLPYGERYWLEIHEAVIAPDQDCETAYLTVSNQGLIDKLLRLGIDESIDGSQLAKEVQSSAVPGYASGKAA